MYQKERGLRVCCLDGPCQAIHLTYVHSWYSRCRCCDDGIVSGIGCINEHIEMSFCRNTQCDHCEVVSIHQDTGPNMKRVQN
jgi:hypothetical protein